MTLPALRPDEFPDFFSAIYGRDKGPFPWQTRLARELAAGGAWRPILNLPTGSGKTATIDVALFHLALEADAGERRRAPVRIAFVVDRRVIVDAARERAELIQQRLDSALTNGDQGDILQRVAKRLAHLSPDNIPLIVRTLRGGIPREDDWARTPSQPTVLCSTVDQVGSRLLFRGYGVSDSMKPVHAGLIGSDCLILLDEAHLSEPFRRTLAYVDQYRKPPWAERVLAPWAFVTLTATPISPELSGFGLLEDDRRHPTLAPRLVASKPARLALAESRSSDERGHASELAQHAWKLAHPEGGTEPPRVIAVVVNRVSLARRCYSAIAALIQSEHEDAEAVLFIGRTREIDRSEIIDRYKNRLISNDDRPAQPLFVVTTQCIEAGADFDFDALVTQVAPLSALRQRFGRLNRTGRPIPAPAVILACPDEVGSRADDPLYGIASKDTWDWLKAQAESQRSAKKSSVDFGISAMERLLKERPLEERVTREQDAPTLLPAYLDLWAQTSPMPDPDPEVALFLHGKPEVGDVQIVWRADIQPHHLQDEKTSQRAREILALMPPRAAEAVSVPIRAARAWLQGHRAIDVADAEGSLPESKSRTAGKPRRAMRWRGAESEESTTVWSSELRPGDLIVVPASYGGHDMFGWHPDFAGEVRDVADLAAEPYRARRFVLRIHREVLRSVLQQHGVSEKKADREYLEKLWGGLRKVLQDARNQPDGSELAGKLATMLKPSDPWKAELERLAEAANSTRAKKPDVEIAFPYDGEDSMTISGVVLIAPKGLLLGKEDVRRTDDAATENDDAGSFRRRRVSLEEHAGDVESKAKLFAELAGLPADRARDVAVAAFLHDEGKRDLRFQAYLRGGDRLLAAVEPTVLAKSDQTFISRAAAAHARSQSELPSRWRHEAESVRRALEHPRLNDAPDKELVLWLIGTHHGYGRPLYPHSDDLFSGPQDSDFLVYGIDWTQLFSKLLRRYGPWELARFEAVLRLSDHRASEEEDEKSDEN